MVLACDVIQPLTGGMCIINSVTDKTVITNSNVKLPADLDLTGIAMGYADGFYGEPDILACPKEQSQKVERPGAVAIQSLSTVEETDDTVSTVKETDETVADVAQHADIIPPARKRRKSNEQRKSSTTGGSPNKTVIEGKKGVSEKTTISALSESLATALTFARIQQKRHSGHHTFPTLRVHPLGVDIILFNAVSDHLMLTCLKWSQQALFMMWLVLHHNIFSFLELPKKYEKYTSGLLSYIANSGAMKTDPKYLVVKNSFELNEAVIEREFRITVWP